MMLTALIFWLSCIVTSVLGAPQGSMADVSPNVLDAINPPILNPNGNTTWVVGNKYNVTWCVCYVFCALSGHL